MKVKVLIRQNWFDIALQHTGIIQNAHLIASANERMLTDDVFVNESISIPDSIAKDKKVIQYLTARNIKPATAEPLMILKEETVGFPLELPADY